MSEPTVCKYNQGGYCRYKLNCRKRHEDKTCPEADNCRSKECLYRHPKLCRNYSTEGSCKFGEDCAYKHKTQSDMSSHMKEVILKHYDEMTAIKDEVSQLKVTVKEMESKINMLTQDIEFRQKTKVEEIVKVVVSMHPLKDSGVLI